MDDKLATKQENIINSLLGGGDWDSVKEQYKLSDKNINSLRESVDFVERLKRKQTVSYIETQNHHHIYTVDSLKALHDIIKTSENERLVFESARALLKGVHENIDTIATLHTRYEIDELRKQLTLDFEE